MADITLIGEKAGRAGSIALDGQGDGETRIFRLESTNRNTSAADFGFVRGLPQVGDPHPDDRRYLAVRVQPTQNPRSWDHWTVKVIYERLPPLESGEDPENPVSLRPTIRWGAVHYSEPVHGAIKNISEGATAKTLSEGVVSSAGEPFDPQIEIDASRPVVSIRRAERVWNPRLYLEFIHCINSDTVTIDGVKILKNQARMFDIRIDNHEFDQKGRPYRWVDYEIQIKWFDWKIRPLDAGTWYLDEFEDKQPFKDEDGNRIIGLLDGAGEALLAGADEVFLEFDVYHQRRFGKLKLPR